MVSPVFSVVVPPPFLSRPPGWAKEGVEIAIMSMAIIGIDSCFMIFSILRDQGAEF